MQIVYLDNAATTPVDPEVREAMGAWLADEFGNPSSRHPLGQRAAAAIEEARRRVARATGARPADVVFTAGGTEACNLAVIGGARARARHGKHVVIGPAEHSCVARAARALEREGFEVEEARLRPSGALDLDDWAARLRPDTVLASQMLVQNEFGTVYPVAELARLVRARAPHAGFHVDAVQGFGKLSVSLAELGADSLAVSAHKVHGPKGVGALVCAPELPLEPLVHGGGQEAGRRSGTENVAGIVGLGAAAKLADARRRETEERTRAAREAFVAGVERLEGVRVLNAPSAERPVVPSIVALVVPGPPAEVWLHHLEARGTFVSSGSACQAGQQELTGARAAHGLSLDESLHLLRVSFSRRTTAEEVARAVADWGAVCEELRAIPS